MRKLIIDTRIRSFAADYKTKLQNQCPDVVSDLEDLSKFVSSNNTFKDTTVVKDYIDAIISAYPTLLTQEPKDWDLKEYNDILKREIQEARDKKDNQLLIETIRKYRNLDDEKKIKVYVNVTEITDDHTRYDIVHRQIEAVRVENIEIYHKFKSGWKKTKAKRVTVIPSSLLRRDNDFLEDEQKYLIITNGGMGAKYLDENVDIDVIYESGDELDDSFGYVKYIEDGYPNTYQVLHVEYLNRFEDGYKIKKRIKEKEKA